jgi:hypothetical protein
LNPEEVLELMGSAPGRYESVRAALRYRGDGPTIEVVRERFARSEAYVRTFGKPPEPSENFRYHEPDSPYEWRCKVWRIDNHRWRQETELPGGGVDIWASTGRIRSRGTRREPPGTPEDWHRRIGGGRRQDDPTWLIPTADTFWTMYPFDSAGFCSLDWELGRLDLEVEGPVSWAGREAVRLKGVPVEEWEHPPEPLWWGADEYEVVIDAERGVLLRTACRLDGEDFDALEVEEIFFDERFGEGVFTSRMPLTWRS